MAVQLLDEFVDRVAFAADTEFAVSQLKSVNDQFQKLKQAGLTVGNSNTFAELQKSLKQSQIELVELRKKNQELAISQRELNQQIKEKVVAERQAAAASKQASSEKMAQIREEKAAQAEKGKSNKDTERAAAAEKKLIRDASNEYFQLNKALQDAELRYKNLALTQGFSNEQTKIALREAISIRNVLDKVDVNLRNYQRNVGNYGSAFNGLGNSFQQVLREAPAAAVSMNTFFLAISNNLPILFDEITRMKAANAQAALVAKEAAAAAFQQAEAQALAAGATKQAAKAQADLAAATILANAEQTKAVPIGQQLLKSVFSLSTLLTVGVLALTLYGGKLVEFIGGLFKTKAAVSELAEQQKALGKVMEDSKSAFVNATVEVNNLKVAIDQAKTGIITKQEAVKLYNETIGKTTGEVKNLDEAEQALTKNADAYIKFTLLKAAANVAAAKSAEKLFDAMVESQKELVPTAKTTNLFGEEFSEKTKQAIITAEKREFTAGKFRRANALRGEADTYKTIFENFLKQAQELSKLFKFDFNAIKEPAGKKDKNSGDKQIQALKELTQTEFELYKIQQEAKIRIFQRDIDSDRTHYLAKLTALNNYLSAAKELLDAEEKEEIAKINREAAREKQRLEEEKRGKNSEQIARIDSNISIVEKNRASAILLVQAQYADKSVQLAQTTADKKNKILDDQFKKDKASYEEFQKFEQDIIDKTNDAFKKGLDKRAKMEEDARKKKIELEKDLQDKRVEFYEKGEELIFSIFTAGIERQKNLIQDEKDAIDKKKDADILAVEKEVLTQQEKADKIAVINAVAAAKKEQLEAKQRKLDLDKAKFDRAQQVFEVGIDTLKSVAKIKSIAAILLANPVTAALATIALAQIPFTIATGLASTAAILAQPLPRYKHGKSDNYAGPAIVGDGGKREVIIREDGGIEFTPDTPTLTNLKAKDIVVRDIETFANMTTNSLINSIINKKVNTADSYDRNQIERLINTVGDIKIFTQVTTKEGQQLITSRYADQRAWEDKYIRN